MNRSSNEFVFGNLIVCFIYLCLTRVSDIIVRVISDSSLYSEDCFHRHVILF